MGTLLKRTLCPGDTRSGRKILHLNLRLTAFHHAEENRIAGTKEQ